MNKQEADLLAEARGNIVQFLELSTSHMMLGDSELLELHSAPSRTFQSSLSVYSYEYGWQVHVCEEGNVDAVREDGFSPQLWGVIDLARSLGCDWIKFDRDGSTIDGLETFDW